jgi:hypothetical protein
LRVRDLDCWPPALTDSTTVQVEPSDSLAAKLKRCGVYTMAGTSEPYLSIVVDYRSRDWHAMIQDVPEGLMRRLEATLRGHEGELLSQLGHLEVVEIY